MAVIAAAACAAAASAEMRRREAVRLRSQLNGNFLTVPPFALIKPASYPGYRKASSARPPSSANQQSTVRNEKKEQPPPDNWKIKMLYDGDCPLCMREVNMLRRRNIRYGTVKFVDITSKDYDPASNQGVEYETAMRRIHAISRDGTVVTDLEAFRKLYEHVGLGWVYALTKYEPIATIADAVYRIWAKYRLDITGRPSLVQILASKRKNKGKLCDRNHY